MNPVTEQTLFEQIGGTAAVNAAVDIFYTRIMADGRLSHFFRWTDMLSQHAKQKVFLTMAFGGPQEYEGKSMREAHAHLVKQGLNHTHFDVLMHHLEDTLLELNVPEALIAQAAQIVESTRNDVLNL